MEKFWEEKPLVALSPDEWEALCDGCGRCCLYKVEAEDGTLHTLGVACRELDLENCRCRCYESRLRRVPECISLTPETVFDYPWLPETCAYRLVALGKELPPWHPLISGDPRSVHTAGVSVRGRVVSAHDMEMDDLEDL